MPLVGPGGRSAPIPRPAAPPRPPPPPPRAAGAPPSHTDVTSSGGNYGTPQANKFKQSPAYHQAVAQVFKAQPPVQQAKIVQGLVRNNAYRSPEFHAIHQAFSSLPAAAKGTIASYAPRETSTFISAGKFTPPQRLDFGRTVAGALGGVLHGAESVLGSKLPGSGGIGDVRSLGGALTPSGGLKVAGKVANETAAGVGAVRQIAHSLPGGRDLANVGNAPGSDAFVKNLARDAVNLPAEALPSLTIPVGEALKGHWGQALHAVTDPYVQALKHPIGAFAAHPLNTALMAGGLLHPATRIADTAQTLARTGHLPNVQAEPIQLTANLQHARPDFSKYPLIRQSQKDVAKSLYQRNAAGQLEPRSEKVRARLIKLETSRLVGQNERVRVARREQQISAHAATVLQPKAARALHAVRTAAKYNPEPALIPGAGVLARIADHVIRRPDTVAADLQKHLNEVAANRPNLAGMPKLLAEHDAYVKQLQDALNNKAFLKNPAPAFKAADQYAKDYAPIEKAAHALGHFRDMTRDALERRALAHTVLTHMPGARMDPERGLMAGDRPLTTEEMRQFDRQQSGGRPVAFTSDQARAGDKAFYVNGQRRPLPAAKGNTYFAFTHGLTHPGHEALLEQRVRMQGIVDAHDAMNRLANHLLLQNEKTGNVKAWASFQAAKHDAPEGYQPIRLAQQFHPQDSLAKAFESGKVDLASLEEEAARRQLDINSRLQPSSEPGQYGLIDQHAANQLRAHENQISPNTFFRGLRGLTNQFRRVALATSFRHLPGVAQEQAIRAAAEGIGPVAWFAGRSALKRAQEISPRLGEARRIQMTGGTASGQALALTTRQVSHHFAGTLLEGPLTAFEKLMAAPGARQAGSAWRAWIHFTLRGTKRFLEENAQTSAIGKQVIADFGGRHGLLSAAMGNWGKMIDQAAHGILDERTAAKMGSYVRRVYGRWTDLTPGEQTALMFSPFGMWWTNSVAWLMRMPVDHPAGAAFFAALNTGTEKQRQALGLDMFSPNHLPLYRQGGIPVGGKLWGANYYTAMGVANDPGETFQSLLIPWQSELVKAIAGQNWKGSTINSPANPRPDFGGRKPSPTEIGTVILNSLLSSFVPLYTKAEQIAEGGASKFDTSTLLRPQTKVPNPGPLQGLKKAVLPIRLSGGNSASGSRGASVPGFGSASGGVSVPGFGSGGNGVAVPGFP